MIPDPSAEVGPRAHRLHDSIEGPEHRKETQLGEVRERYRSLGHEWLKSHVPGLFCSGEGLVPPVWDLILTQNEQLFADEPVEDRWRETLGFGRVFDRWTSDRLAGLHLLARPHGERNRAVPTFAGREPEVLRMLEGEHKGDDLYGLMQHLHSHLTDPLALWTLQQALAAHERRFTIIRDELAAPPSWHGAGRRLRRLRREVMPLAFDLETLHEASQNADALAMPTRYSDVDFTATQVSVGGKLLRRPEETLMEQLRNVIRERGESISSQGREITNALRVQGELLLAATNVRLQWMVLGLTLLVGAASLYASLNAS